ncbi:hypothetical protein [Burkholderia ubonensis]|uniref:hypothetical protein n=1 Tax=Burkholderia ubonensis TaxID=101571 RepID=UPI00075468D6|nr:hypothetical protein [Burkholderia ubonensis]KVD70143.1 hypothetical protein WI88_30880 [Burkholderia ubonensis]
MARRIAVATLLAVVAASAMAEDQQCAATRKNTVPQALAVVNELDSHIEAVPPDEASYLQTEYVAAMKEHNEARYSLVVARQYYPAWTLHGSLQRLRNELNDLKGPTYGESRERYQAKQAAVVMVRLAFAVNDWMDYSRADSRRTQHVTTAAQKERYSEELGGLPLVLSTYISCTVDAIK